MLVRERGEERIPERRARLWSAFAYRDFRLLWTGLFVSNIGFWMQFTSLTYLVGVILAHNAAQSALSLGILGAVRSIPVLLLSPISGFVADHFPRRRTLLITNSMQTLLALALAFVSELHGSWILLAVYLIAAAQAATQCFDAPARQSWVPLLVPRHLISNAIGLNSIAFNGPLMVGPAVAGLLIGTVGLSVAFFVNAASQLAVVAALILMKPAPASSTSREPVVHQIVAGARFIGAHAVLKWVFLLLLVTSLTVRPFTSLLAAFAAHILLVGAQAYGWLLAAGGIGTVTGAIITAVNQSERRGRLWFAASVVSALGLIGLGFTHSFGIAMFLQAMLGLGTMTFVSSSNVLVQTLSPDEMRGRSMSVYTMILLGLVPAGTLLMGSLGSVLGLPEAFALGGTFAFLVGAWVWFAHPALRGA
ncbi:MAG: MFS transporter [Candidatus Eremiobacteraeota bacterium]|nr:MFS transporter [Candidatus Eremiobacteraeota bacterium]